MEGSWRTTPLTAIASDTFLMTCIEESLMDNTPLEGGIVVVIHSHILLTTPAKAAMVDDDVTGILDAYGSTFDKAFFFRAFDIFSDTQSRTDIADDDILRSAQIQLAATQQDALARCCLSCYRHILQFSTDGTLVLTLRIGTDVDDATHAKYDGGILATCLS